MDMPKYGGEVVTWRMSQLSTHQSDCRYGQIWRPSCPEQQIRPLCPYMVMYICYKSNAHNNNIYGDSPSAAMPKYGVCCLTSYMATNEACPNMGNGHSGRICCSGQLGLHIWAYLQSDWCVDNCDITVLSVSSKLGLHIWAYLIVPFVPIYGDC